MGNNFKLGQIVVTRGIDDRMTESKDFINFVQESLSRLMACGWGDSYVAGSNSNDYAVKNEERILAVYTYADDTRIWIITEWDRSMTTILFPEEY